MTLLFVPALLAFTAFVSGGTYGWARDLFIAASLMVLLAALLFREGARAKAFVPALVLLSVNLLSLIFTVSRADTAGQVFFLSGCVAFAYAASGAAATASGKRAVLMTVFFVSVAVSLYAIYQYYVGFAHTEEYLDMLAAKGGAAAEYAKKIVAAQNRRAFSTMLSPNALACWLAASAPLTLSLARADRRLRPGARPRSPSGSRCILRSPKRPLLVRVGGRPRSWPSRYSPCC